MCVVVLLSNRRMFIAHGHVPAVCIGDDLMLREALNSRHHLKTASLSCVCA